MPEMKVSPMILMPQVNLADEINSSLPLEKTEVRAHLTGPLAAVEVTQRFSNPLHEPADLDYLFPVPDGAAITAFELKIGERRIQGDLRELEAAREEFEQARQQGRRAGLLEQRRTNLFSVWLANVRPGETILASLSYQQRLKFEDDSYEFVFPMGITPKYDSPSHPHEGDGTQAPLAGVGEKIGPVEIEVTADAGVALVGEPKSPSHPLQIHKTGERGFQASLAGMQLPDHDFVLRYSVASDSLKAAAWTSVREGNTIFLATLVPPRLEDEHTPPAREFVFVLDRSGSMTGQPIQQARNALRACLRSTGADDTIRILLFDDKVEWYRSEPVKLTQQELEKADAFLAKVEGRGGTEIVGAIEAALKIPVDPAWARFVVFLTDGAVSAEERALDQVRSQIGAARVFTFGIGPSVNRALLSRMARLGRGRAEFLQLNEDIEGAIIRFQDSVSFPVLTDLALTWENGQAWDVYPARLPDLYAGQPLEVCGFVKPSGTGPQMGPLRLALKGRRAGQEVTVDVNLPEAAASAQAADISGIERVWARARVDDLLEQQELEPSKAAKIRAEILGLAIEYKLVTELTAFVAVDSESGDLSGLGKVIHVSQPLPQGLNRGAFEPQVRMAMAMSAAPLPPAAASAAGSIMRSVSASSRMFKKMSPKAIEDSEAQDILAAPAGGHMLFDRADQSTDRQGQDMLRELARSQRADGSWGGDAEQTAAVLLAFVRAGQTTRVGSFRTPLRKAVQWLKGQKPGGLAAFVRARALAELAQATGEASDAQAAQEARAALPRSGTALESAALEGTGQAITEIKSLDDLRMAVLLKLKLPVLPALLNGKDAELARAWAACL